MAGFRQFERDCDADKNLADFEPPRWYYSFFTSHPPIPERVAMARRIEP